MDEQELAAGSPAQGPPIRGEIGIAGIVPFGLDKTGARPYRGALQAAWDNRDGLGFAWRILRNGVCDGCSLGPRGLADDASPGLHLCGKRLERLRELTAPVVPAEVLADRAAAGARGAAGRLGFPAVARPGGTGFERLGWDEALALAGATLAGCAPERVAFLADPVGPTDETWYTLAKLARVIGTPHVELLDGAGAAREPLQAALGWDASTCSLSELVGTDLVLVWPGDLPGRQPAALRHLAAAKREGARVVALGPAPDARLARSFAVGGGLDAVFGARLTDDFVRVAPGGEAALTALVLRLLVEWGAVDRAWIDAHTVGFDVRSRAVANASPDRLLAAAGARYGEVEWLARVIARSRSMVSVWSPGDADVTGIVDLHLARGAIGRPRSGLLVLEPQAGIAGARACGLGAGTAPAADLELVYRIGDPRPGPAARFRILQHHRLDPRALPEPAADGWVLLLPARTRYEQPGGGICLSTERRLRFTPEIDGHPVVGESRPAWEILAAVGRAARPAEAAAFGWTDVRGVRAEMARELPRYAGCDRLARAGDWLQWGGPALGADGVFGLPDGRARFSAPREDL